MLTKILVLLAIIAAVVVGYKLLTSDKPQGRSGRRPTRGARSEPVDLVTCDGCGAWKQAGADCQTCGRKTG
ncbi:MAG: hypothetical protein VYB54_09860 [Pseudomonadota bacterium]|nr:hypothetical protein [Pseudomonadota bacterium]